MTTGQPSEAIGALFRREAGRMTSALVRLFGPRNLPLVEDVVQGALVRALETWKLAGVPENPAAWLMTAAKNGAIDVLRRDKRAREVAAEVQRAGAEDEAIALDVDAVFHEDALRDEQLRMMFACCHARLAEEVQVALVLHLLGGFGVREVAGAFLVSPAAMEKRLQRGKQVLAEAPGLPEVTADRVEAGLAAVHGAIYLVFNEGYHGNHPEETVRADLCAEAIRLATLLSESPATAKPETHALLALMLFSAARLPGRVDASGELMPLEAQDRGTWDMRLVRRGIAALEAAAWGDRVSPWHVEAAIAYEHAAAPTYAQTNWPRIVSLYDTLCALRPSPVAALSRAIAIGEREGPERALEEIARIEGSEKLREYPFYFAAVGEEELRAGHLARARASFEQAVAVARSPLERRYLEKRRARCVL